MSPYVAPERRSVLDALLEPLTGAVETGGDLNYCATYLVKALVRREGGESYSVYRGLLGDLLIAILELHRTDVGPYEESRRKANGDVLLASDEDTTEKGW